MIGNVKIVETRHPRGIGPKNDAEDDYKPGDPPPSDYCERQEWARAQYRAGLRQKPCTTCARLKFPQELSARSTQDRPLCKECDDGSA